VELNPQWLSFFASPALNWLKLVTQFNEESSLLNEELLNKGALKKGLCFGRLVFFPLLVTSGTKYMLSRTEKNYLSTKLVYNVVHSLVMVWQLVSLF